MPASFSTRLNKHCVRNGTPPQSVLPGENTIPVSTEDTALTRPSVQRVAHGAGSLTLSNLERSAIEHLFLFFSRPPVRSGDAVCQTATTELLCGRYLQEFSASMDALCSRYGPLDDVRLTMTFG